MKKFFFFTSLMFFFTMSCDKDTDQCRLVYILADNSFDTLNYEEGCGAYRLNMVRNAQADAYEMMINDFGCTKYRVYSERYTIKQ